MVRPSEHRRSHGLARRGFTVVEVLVALIVVAAGLLGVAGASALALRASNAAMREQAAVSRARSRLALIEAGGCGSAVSGERHLATGLVDRWNVGPLGHGVRLVDVSAEWEDTGRRRTLTLRSALLC
jgi:prepilin-type N-terminal cleavage/methylation domain-containing protein